jgi:hypothetical protein
LELFVTLFDSLNDHFDMFEMIQSQECDDETEIEDFLVIFTMYFEIKLSMLRKSSQDNKPIQFDELEMEHKRLIFKISQIEICLNRLVALSMPHFRPLLIRCKFF